MATETLFQGAYKLVHYASASDPFSLIREPRSEGNPMVGASLRQLETVAFRLRRMSKSIRLGTISEAVQPRTMPEPPQPVEVRPRVSHQAIEPRNSRQQPPVRLLSESSF